MMRTDHRAWLLAAVAATSMATTGCWDNPASTTGSTTNQGGGGGTTSTDATPVSTGPAQVLPPLTSQPLPRGRSMRHGGPRVEWVSTDPAVQNQYTLTDGRVDYKPTPPAGEPANAVTGQYAAVWNVPPDVIYAGVENRIKYGTRILKPSAYHQGMAIRPVFQPLGVMVIGDANPGHEMNTTAPGDIDYVFTLPADKADNPISLVFTLGPVNVIYDYKPYN